MILRDGFQSFEFLQALELPRPLFFATPDDALKWLKNLTSQRPEMLIRFRDYVIRFLSEPEAFRVTDHQVLERMAGLLHSRRVVVISREDRAAGAAPTAAQTSAPAFPLSQRAQRETAPSTPAQQSADPSTFSPNTDQTAQAAALVAAAADGKPFCPE
jgi:hypothetical protein